MLALDVFLSRLLPSVLGCPDPVARQALLDAAIEFCEETQVVQVISEPQAVTQGVGPYDLDLPSQQTPVLTLKAWYGTRQLAPVPAALLAVILAREVSVTGETAAQGEPQYYFESAPGVVSVYPRPDATRPSSLTALVATKPTRAATQVEDILFENWAEAIVAGAKARLHSIPDQPYFALPMAAMAHSQFWHHVGRARSDALRGRLRGSVSLQPRAFA